MSPTDSEMSARDNKQNLHGENNQSISRIESVNDDGNHGGAEDLLLSDIHQNQSVNRIMQEGADQEDLD
jgi:hypothetical protein